MKYLLNLFYLEYIIIQSSLNYIQFYTNNEIQEFTGSYKRKRLCLKSPFIRLLYEKHHYIVS